MLAAAAVFGQVSIGIRIGAPPPPRVIRVQPPSPGPGYLWVTGYWYPSGNKYKWHEGYWTRPPYASAHWVEPHHDGQRYFEGYWDGERGHVAHDHKWDKGHGHDRDYNHDHDR
jgi:YXWGXW repeat-containing protein